MSTRHRESHRDSHREPREPAHHHLSSHPSHNSHPPPLPHSSHSQSHVPHHPHPNGSSSSHISAIVSPIQGGPPPPLTNGSANGVSNGVSATAGPGPSSAIHKLAAANEQTWLLIGRVAEQMNDLDHALSAYENALRHNPLSLAGLTQVAGIARSKENYPKAIDYFQRVLQLQEDNGEVWSALGHCYLMQDDLPKAYSAYQQALYLLPNPKEDPKLWYGIGILYDRYGSLDHAEEAFSSVLRMDKDLDFDKANEILFRLGIIYKQQSKFDDSLQCFDRILRNPPSPLAHADIWFQIGHVYEQQKDHASARDAYERVVTDNPTHAKVLQQLGWLYHQDGSTFQNQDLAIQYLTKSLEADPSDAQSWYLLGRAYMAGQKYNKAYEAYQQAVYRDGRNPTFWCSIGVLYFQINQYRDALDAYSRAIRINPYISEVWFDLGSLYESCNNQISDAIDAYARASELDPGNKVIEGRLALLKTAQANGGASSLGAAPGPQDVHPTAYASAVVPPTTLNLNLPLGRPSSINNEISLPPPTQRGGSPTAGPFRGGPPPPLILDDSRHQPVPGQTVLAPMDVDRPVDRRERGLGHQSLLLHHPVPAAAEERHFARHRAVSASMSPPPHPALLSSRRATSPGFPREPREREPREREPRERRPSPRAEDWERRGEDRRGDWERERRYREPYAVRENPASPRYAVKQRYDPRWDAQPPPPSSSASSATTTATTTTPTPTNSTFYDDDKRRRGMKEEPLPAVVPPPEPKRKRSSHIQTQHKNIPTHSPAGSSSGRSSVGGPPRRVVDDDYDEPGVADALMGLANLKRPLSPAPADDVSKRSRIESTSSSSSSASQHRQTPVPSTRPSPIPFRTQGMSVSRSPPENTQNHAPASPPLPAVFPPHPRPVGNNGMGLNLPPITTLSPEPTGDEKMQVDSRSVSPPTTTTAAMQD